MLTFEWDDAKNQANLLKHGITFEQATEIFLDPLSLTIQDPEHSDVEDRFITIGMTKTGLVAVASHTDREDTIRIISARRATNRERISYEST
jgi:uncharacterized protein